MTTQEKHMPTAATVAHERQEAEFYGREDVDPEIAALWRGQKCWAGFVAKRIDAAYGVSDEYPWSVY